MPLSSTLWEDNRDLALASLHSPFVQGLLDGSLEKDIFSHYVGQDVFFLKAFARAYIIAGAKAPDWQDFIKLHKLAAGVLDELELHNSYAQQWDVDVNEASPGSATRRYTDFVMSTAWGYDTGLTVTALTPCMRLYAWLGKKLADLNPSDQYMEWINTYSSPGIEALACDLEGLVDKYALLDDPQVRTTYRYAMECERDFFQAAFEMTS